MPLADLTRQSVVAALDEFDRLGRDVFLAKYGFKGATRYFVERDGKHYDSKAIAGAAHRRLIGGIALSPSEFSGGDKTVRSRLEALGFTVVVTDEPAAQRNPPWIRDELILALDLYFRHRPDTISKNHPEVIALSELLNELPLQTVRPDAHRFRNPNGTYMKLCNFLRFDPDYHGKGLEAGGKAEELVWKEFAGDRERLRDVAAAIRKDHKAPEVVGGPGTDDDDADAEEFPEGRILWRMHRARERSVALRDKAKTRALRKTGKLLCEACGFDFAATYGALGEGYIECHHTRPVSTLTEGAKTKVDDLALLCANCHRMVHRRRPWLAIEALAALVTGNKRKRACSARRTSEIAV